MRIVSAAFTHVGRRNNNEDAHCREPELGVYAVADGMGGYEGGEIASKLAVDTIVDFVRRNVADDNVTWPYKMDRGYRLDENLALIAARLANDEVHRRRVGHLAQMGSTLVFLYVTGDQAILVHLGDSRIYRLRDGRLEQMTQDHSVYAELARAGGPMPPKAETSFGHMITRALGMNDAPAAELTRVPIAAGDTFLLCSDGLSEMVTDDELKAGLAGADLEAAVQALVQRAYDAGGRDNITAVLARAVE